jgi:hypothetical protein
LEDLRAQAAQEEATERALPAIEQLAAEAAKARAEADRLATVAEQRLKQAAALLKKRDLLTVAIETEEKLLAALDEMIDRHPVVQSELKALLVEHWSNTQFTVQRADPYDEARHANAVRNITENEVELEAINAAKKIVTARLKESRDGLASVMAELEASKK